MYIETPTRVFINIDEEFKISKLYSNRLESTDIKVPEDINNADYYNGHIIYYNDNEHTFYIHNKLIDEDEHSEINYCFVDNRAFIFVDSEEENVNVSLIIRDLDNIDNKETIDLSIKYVYYLFVFEDNIYITGDDLVIYILNSKTLQLYQTSYKGTVVSITRENDHKIVVAIRSNDQLTIGLFDINMKKRYDIYQYTLGIYAIRDRNIVFPFENTLYHLTYQYTNGKLSLQYLNIQSKKEYNDLIQILFITSNKLLLLNLKGTVSVYDINTKSIITKFDTNIKERVITLLDSNKFAMSSDKGFILYQIDINNNINTANITGDIHYIKSLYRDKRDTVDLHKYLGNKVNTNINKLIASFI